MNEPLSHSQLVDIAGRWLRGTRKCAVVATERSCFKSSESPDAIGWRPDGQSVLVEAKVSLEDFRADHRKEHRRETIGMGVERWYIVPEGLMSQPGRAYFPPKWGLLEVKRGRVYRVSAAIPRVESSGEIARIEQPLLIALVRRTEWAALSGSSAPLNGITITDAPDMEAV